MSLFTLFAMSLGDELSNTFEDVTQINFLFGFIYIYCFIFFAFCVLMNIFLIIIGDAYAVVKDRHKYQWLEDVNLFHFYTHRVN